MTPKLRWPMPVESRPDPRGRGGIGWVTVIAALVAAALVLTGECPLPLHLLAGFFLLVALPVQLVTAKINWPQGVKFLEALLYSLGLVVLGLIVGGLLINQVLPLAGISRPLDRVPVIVTLLFALTCLGAWRPGRLRVFGGLGADVLRRHPIGLRDQALLTVGVLVFVAAVAGAIRLNNGAGGTVTPAMLVVAAGMIIAVLCWRSRLDESTIIATIYLLAVSLLLMTSLRGWFVTGHDSQREYRVFKLASQSGVWDIAAYRDAYNACMSVTILPTIIEHVTGIPDVYVYKVVYQALYALCPVLIYLVARRFGSRLVAVLAAVYFIAFPTFFGDMPFLNRQEAAFFFLGLTLLLITNADISIRTRRIGAIVFGVGIMLSHYSTTYVTLAVFSLAWLVHGTWMLVRRRRKPAFHRVTKPGPAVQVMNLTVIGTLAVLTFLWVALTGTGGVVEETFATTLSSLTGRDANGLRSADSSYSIFGGKKSTPDERLGEYKAEWISTTEEREADGSYPLSEVEKYPTPTVPMADLPLTSVGEAFEQAGVDVSTLNKALRGGATVALQLFIAIGLLGVILGYARGFSPSVEMITGAVACMVAITLHVLLPFVSVNYGILRTFAQGLFWLSPFLAVGSIQAFSWLGRAISVRIGSGFAIVFFLSLTGVIPQVLGGYPPQLHLNNAGLYYDIYYLHSQEIAAMNWIEGRLKSDVDGSVQTEAATDRYAVNRLQNYTGIEFSDDIFPMLIRRNTYAFLGFAGIRKGEATFNYGGDIVIYKYPVEFLDRNKSLLYSSDGAGVYR